MHFLPVLESVRAQLKAVLAEIARLEGSEFPYPNSKEGLKEIQDIFFEHLNGLSQLTDENDKDTIELACKAAFSSIEGSLEFLGFILRSTNLRNAFEIYGPLLRISRQIIGEETKLIISSEWNFSPFTFIGYEYLPNFVLIGLPASESSNPFLIPLAGHELGHTVWLNFSYVDSYKMDLENKIVEDIKNRWDEYSSFFPNYSRDNFYTDLFAQQTWMFALDWSKRQTEELFCDFIGLRIFGESYLHAFAYLTAPPREGKRPCEYPNVVDRAKALALASEKYSLSTPEGYENMFKDLQDPFDNDKQLKFLLSLADAARFSIQNRLIIDADKIVLNKIEKRSPQLIEQCKKAFRLMVPAQNSEQLSNILNAAWEALLETDFFLDANHNKKKQEYLTEIVLKSVEVFEIESRLNQELN